MVGVSSGFCGLYRIDALGSPRDRRSNLNVAILQRRVSAHHRRGEEIAGIDRIKSGVGIGIGVGVEKARKAKADPDSDSDPDPDQKS